MVTEAQMSKLEQLEQGVSDAKAHGNTKMSMKVARRPRPDAVRIRVLPGVMGELVQWGDGTDRFPTVAFVEITDLERFLARCRAEVPATAPGAAAAGAEE